MTVPSIRRLAYSSSLSTLALVGLLRSVSAQEHIDLPGEDRPLVADAQEVFNVGSITGEEWETLAKVVAVSFDEKGNLYVLDPLNFRVLVVGPDGEFVRNLGRRGGGPGEFGLPYAFSVTRLGEVRVFDLRQRGFTLFNPDGILKTTVPAGNQILQLRPAHFQTHPGGGVLTARRGEPRAQRTPDGKIEFPSTRPVHHFKFTNETELTTVYEGWNPATARGDPDLRMVEAAGLRMQSPPARAFDPEIRFGVLPDGRIALTDSTDYAVKILELGEGVRKVFRRPLLPRDVKGGDRKAEKERRLGEMSESGTQGIAVRGDRGNSSNPTLVGVRALAKSRIEIMEFADQIPVIAGMAVDWSGRIWLERTGARIGEEGPIDILSPAGSYLGTIAPGGPRLPDAFGPGGLAAYVETDEMDVPRVVVRRLTLRRVE